MSSSDDIGDDRKGVRFKGSTIVKQRDLWKHIAEEFDENKRNVESYLKLKHSEEVPLTINPIIDFLDKNIFPVLNDGLVQMFTKLKEENSFYNRKSALIGLDYLAEYLWNMNTLHPERKDTWTYIFDMDWVKKYLAEHPRPFYPFHLIWNKNYAVLKIQSYMRGYWIRRREDVQEMRQFWKNIKKENWRLNSKKHVKMLH